MIRKRAIKVSIIIFLVILFIGLGVISCFYLFVPGYVEKDILLPLLKKSGVEVTLLNVRAIGPLGTEISDIKIGPDDGGILIDSIRLDYTPSGLFKKHINRVVLSGISINAKYENDKLSITGLDEILNKKDNSKEDSNTAPPVTIDEIKIVNSTLDFGYESSNFRIPLEISATSFDNKFIPHIFTVMIYPEGNRVNVSGTWEDNNIKLAVKSDEMALVFFEKILRDMTPVSLKGKSSFDLAAIISIEPFSIKDISASFKLDKTRIAYSGVILTNPSAPLMDYKPINISVNSKDAQRFNFEISPVILNNSGLHILSQLAGSLDIGKEGLKGDIKALTQLLAGDNMPALAWDVAIERRTDTTRVQIGAKEDEENMGQPFRVSINNTDIIAVLPEIEASVLFDKGIISGDYLFRLKMAGAKSGDMSLSLPAVSVKGNIRQDENNMNQYISSFTLNSREIIFNSPDIKANIPEHLVKGEIIFDPDKGINIDTGANFKKGVVSMKDGAIIIKEIAGDFPFSWPLDKSYDRGKLSIGNFTYGDYALGPVSLKIAQKNGDISFAGTVKYPALADMIINLKGSTSLTSKSGETNIKADIPAYRPAAEIDLGKFAPELKGYKFNGLLKTDGEINLAGSLIKSGFDINIENGKLSNKETKLTLQDILLSLKLDDIISPRSPFGQKIKIGKASFGDISVNDVAIDFRVDSLSSIFIEQGRFKWSGGNINLQSFMVDTKKDEYLIILFCDRLKLSDLLEQFGVFGVSGGGTVNGRIPITISKGKISFQDGFLYSTPGGGGKINIQGTDIFKEGMAPGTPEYIQMDIASEALKAFDYSWVKLSLDSNDGELAVKLQFDGKPENKLPFRYDKDLSRFMRVETSSEGSNFQGISLDVNFKLPLDELLNYKGALDMIK
ncbi:MAG: YdbH domain-containing protein [Deltaproteobacteria bacterium]|nr:YdbH domain-containing protein [Deltaproteobacteria bacterium]